MSQITSGNFTFVETPLPGVLVVETRTFGDERGFFAESYKRPNFEAGGIADTFVQENRSVSRKGVLRGLHFQRQHPQSKLGRVYDGAAFDVAVDLRPASPTFGQWFGVELTGDNCRQLYLPHGCAHGILMLSERVAFSYLSDDVYHPEDEAAVAWDDPSIAVAWPLPASQIIVSAKDAANPRLSELSL